MVFHAAGLGFRRKGSWHRIVDIEKCVISNEAVNRLIQEIRSFFKEVDYFHLKKNSGTFRYAVIRAPGEDTAISFVLNADSTRLLEAREKIQEFARVTSAANLIVSYVPSNRDVSVSGDYFVVKGSDMLKTTLLDHKFVFNVQGFFQNNDAMASRMHQYVRDLLKSYDTAGFHLVDLYGGVGTFGIINADLFRETTIIESFPPAAAAAVKNIEENHISNIKVLELDAKRLKNAALSSPLTVITDPPRSGMHPKTIHELNRLHPELIIYVSCNLKQLKVDLDKLKDYRIKSAALFDFFPQTPHSEAVVELVAGK